jgi:pilus assembly protein Flp/PilA
MISRNEHKQKLTGLVRFSSSRNGETIMAAIVRFLKDESGATAMEYGLIVAGISIAIVAAISNLAGGLKGTFSTASGGLANAGK